MARPDVPPFAEHSHLRTIPESRLVESLLFHNWPRADRLRDPDSARRTIREAMARWRDLGVPVTLDARGERCYDPAEMALCMRMAGYEGGDPYWRKHHLPSVRELILSFHPPGTAADRAPQVTALSPRHIVVTMQRRFNPAYLAPNGRLRLPVPQVDASLRNLHVTLDPVSGSAGSVRLADGYAELRLTSAPVEPVVLGARFAFDAYPDTPTGGQTLSAGDREMYLRASEDMVQVTPGVVALAESLAEGAATPFAKVYRFYAYVTKRIDCAPFPYEILNLVPPDLYPPQMGWFDCRRLSAFLVSLCRAAGIPARRVTGYLIYPPAINYHHWVEVWMDDKGWLPIDQLSAELAAVGQDPAWADALVGVMDYRMKLGYLPRAFNGSPGVRLPVSWTSLECDADGDTQTDIVDMSNNATVWTDTLRVELGATLAAD